eukprot:scaffold21579_cov73-Phaeocystis_antarctica.AAC.4
MALALCTRPSFGDEKACCCGNLARFVNLTVARTVRITVLSFCLGVVGTMAHGLTAKCMARGGSRSANGLADSTCDLLSAPAPLSALASNWAVSVGASTAAPPRHAPPSNEA